MPRVPKILPVIDRKIDKTNKALTAYNAARAEEAIDRNPRGHYERYLKILLDENSNYVRILEDLDQAVLTLVNRITRVLKGYGHNDSLLTGEIAKACQRVLDRNNCKLNIADESPRTLDIKDVARGGR